MDLVVWSGWLTATVLGTALLWLWRARRAAEHRAIRAEERALAFGRLAEEAQERTEAAELRAKEAEEGVSFSQWAQFTLGKSPHAHALVKLTDDGPVKEKEGGQWSAFFEDDSVLRDPTLVALMTLCLETGATQSTSGADIGHDAYDNVVCEIYGENRVNIVVFRRYAMEAKLVNSLDGLATTLLNVTGGYPAIRGLSDGDA